MTCSRVDFGIALCDNEGMKKPKTLPKDANQRALAIVKLSTEDPDERSEVSKYLAEIGRKGGLKGGKARAKKLTPQQRKEIARKAAKVRWTHTH